MAAQEQFNDQVGGGALLDAMNMSVARTHLREARVIREAQVGKMLTSRNSTMVYMSWTQTVRSMRYTFVVPLQIVYALHVLRASPLLSVVLVWVGAKFQYSSRRLHAKYGRPVSTVMQTGIRSNVCRQCGNTKTRCGDNYSH